MKTITIKIGLLIFSIAFFLVNSLTVYGGKVVKYQGDNKTVQYRGSTLQYQGSRVGNRDPKVKYREPSVQYQGSRVGNRDPKVEFRGSSVVYQGEKSKSSPQGSSSANSPKDSSDGLNTYTSSSPKGSKTYSDYYRETYTADNYAERYRKNYRYNPIYTGSVDWRSRNRIQFNFPSYGSGGVYYRSSTRTRLLPDPPLIPAPLPNPPLPSSPSPYQTAPSYQPVQQPYPQYPPQTEEIYIVPSPLNPPPPPTWRLENFPHRSLDVVADAPEEVVEEDVAQEEVEQLIVRSPHQIMFTEAMRQMELRNYIKARNLFKQLAAIKSDDEELLIANGLAHFALGDYSTAKNLLQTGTQLARKRGQLVPYFGNYFNSDRDYEILKEKLARYIDKNPDDTNATTLLLMLNQPEEE